jgi:DNA primase
MSVADEIKARLNIVDYVQQFAQLKRAGKTYKACCPFHNERTPSFVVNPDTQSWRCFGACAEGGDVISFAMKRHGWSFSEALAELGKLTGVEVRRQTPEQKAEQDQHEVLRGLLQSAADAYHEGLIGAMGRDVLAYATGKRGLTAATISQFKIGYALPGWTHLLDYLTQLGYTPDQAVESGMAIRNDEGRVYDRFRNRLMIPIRDERGRVIGFGARALAAEDNPKYLNSPQTPLFDKSKTLFGFDMAKSAIRDSETAVIVEGYMDAIQAHQAGFANVVAQMGTAMTDTQIRTLTRTAKRIVLALDADAAGQNATRRSLETARAALQADFGGRLGVDIRILSIPGAKDPDDLIRETPDQWAALVAGAQPVADWLIAMEMAELPPNASIQEREAVARRVLPLLTVSEDNLYQRDNLQKLSLRLKLPERELLDWAAEQTRIEKARQPRPAPPRPAAPTFHDGEPPPLDLSTLTPPEPDENGGAVVELPAPRRSAVPFPELEQQCLRILLRQPTTLYAVNRTLRALAENDRLLLDGPLTDLCLEDFSHSDLRAIMQVFLDAIQQVDAEPLDYLRQQIDPSLQPHLDAILTDDALVVYNRVRGMMSADLRFVWQNNQRVLMSVDGSAELVEKALYLRGNRLKREREILSLMQVDAAAGQDDNANVFYTQQIILSKTAKQRIDAELGRLGTVQRE